MPAIALAEDAAGPQRAALLRLAYVMLGDRQRAEDLVQATALALLGHGEDLPDAAYAAYARRTLIRLATKQQRRMWRREAAVEVVPEVAARDPYLEADDRMVLGAALQELPAKQRAVIALRYLEDRSEAETASTLGCSLGTVKSRGARGLATLRARLQHEWEPTR